MSEKKKYVVEASEPQDGQELSSGGIRNKKNKTIAEMYSKPVPYEEYVNTSTAPAPRAVVHSHKELPQTDRCHRQTKPQSQLGTHAKKAATGLLVDVGTQLWAEYEPRITSYVCNKVVTFIDDKLYGKKESPVKEPARQNRSITKAEILLEQRESAAATTEIDMPSNVIQFPSRIVS